MMTLQAVRPTWPQSQPRQRRCPHLEVDTLSIFEPFFVDTMKINVVFNNLFTIHPMTTRKLHG